jgi:hypothetical protein
MTTYIYNPINLPVKDRLTISNLLGLFQSRLTASWVPASQAPGKPVHVVLIDVDDPDGVAKWTGTKEARIALTSDDRSTHQPFILRPIRAYGANGVIVLFNAIAQSLSAPREAEPSRLRMMGRFESPAEPVRTIRPPAPPTAKPAAPAPPHEVREPRVVIRWGPPEPVILRPLTRMPGAHIHVCGQAAPVVESAAPVVAPTPSPVPEAPAKLWNAPAPDPLPQLVDMPEAHRPVEIHTPATPIIGRVNPEPRPVVEVNEDIPVLRAAPPEWKAPEPETDVRLFDFRSLSEIPVAPEIELEALFAQEPPDLENLSRALSGEEEVAELDWWGTAELAEETEKPAAPGCEQRCELIQALKAIKASGEPSILEIAGLPAVCVIPARNIYFTTAPSARLETAIGAHIEVTWRTCASEAEAREESGTEHSRQASLEQLFWTASLMSPVSDAENLADRAVRLRRWPPVTESRGRSKLIRYCTMISGAPATPRELAEITGDTLDEIVHFIHACSTMNLLETSGSSKANLAATPVRTAGAGILRDMIEQLAPPKL